MNYILGVDNNQISNSNILTSNNIVNFLNDTLFYIKVNNFNNNLIQDNSY